MRDLLLALILLGACGPRAGDNCPPVPQPGQVCSAEGAKCLYAQPKPCTPYSELQCTSGRWVMGTAMLPASCDASTDAPADAPKDATNSSDG